MICNVLEHSGTDVVSYKLILIEKYRELETRKLISSKIRFCSKILKYSTQVSLHQCYILMCQHFYNIWNQLKNTTLKLSINKIMFELEYIFQFQANLPNDLNCYDEQPIWEFPNQH